MKYLWLIAGLLLCPPVIFPHQMTKPDYHEIGVSQKLKPAVINTPNVQVAVHNIGDVWLTVSNIGQFGIGGFLGTSVDPISGMQTPSCMYPANSKLNYLYVAGFWIGAVIGRDTLVSIGVNDWIGSDDVREFWPDPGEDAPPYGGGIVRRSIQETSPFYSIDAKSEQDIIAVYTDTLTDPTYVFVDDYDGRPHIPLDIEVTQRTYGWSYSYAKDFILFDYSIKNIGRRELKMVYMAVYVDGDVHHESLFGEEGYGDDLCGFRRTFPAPEGCGFVDTINIAYITDNDGDPNDQGTFDMNSARGAAGIRVVRTPSDSLKYSFNWWAGAYDASNEFGPRRVGTPEDPFRDMDGYLGVPLGDKNKYYVMRHTEFDYDQLFAAKDHTGDGWLPRPANANDMANGYDARYLLSFGPFNIMPGEILPVSFAWVLGDEIHVYPDDYNRYYDANYPDQFYESWDFSNLARNAIWASWIYDNPGIDTDNDGENLGKFRICGYDSAYICHYDTIQFEPDTIVDTTCGYELAVADTFWYEGDGVPDFLGASPPPAPDLWVIDTTGDTLRSRIYPYINEYNQGELRIKWNGMRSETTRDVFSKELDFEGYRVYLAYSPNASEFTLLASYDIEDYNRYAWNNIRRIWELTATPFSLDSLKQLYGNGFNPYYYNRDNPLYWNDSAYYFTAQDWNMSDLRDTMQIHKIYADELPPSTLNLDSARIYYPEELTAEGLYFKYYEYEYVLRNLLPSQLHYVAVTAFDYGSPVSGLLSLETPPQKNYVAELPQNSAGLVEDKGLEVIVYPNPYRINGDYKKYGFEGRDYIDNHGNFVAQTNLADDRIHSIHFGNLPSKCTIRIFSIDGDLIRVIDHDVPPDHPQSSHERWDMITRNTQMVASGIYYYSVESEFGNQIGTIVIIM
nr:hypothetical protein [candidate division Zixibacteria bacterium]